MTSLNFLYMVFFISIVLHILGLIGLVSIVTPLAIREVGVKNGLYKLRKQLLSLIVFLIFLGLASIVALTLRYFISNQDLQRYIITSMILLHSTAYAYITYIIIRIYTQQYTVESKKLHEKIARLEDRRKK